MFEKLQSRTLKAVTLCGHLDGIKIVKGYVLGAHTPSWFYKYESMVIMSL